MNTLYHWVGFAVVWGGALAAVWVGWKLRPRNAFTRRLGNAWWWVRARLFRAPLRVPADWPTWAFQLYQPRRTCKLDGWERSLVACFIRHGRRYGFRATPSTT